MGTLQEEFNANRAWNFKLLPGEYEGPLLVDHSCVIDGFNATLWANQGSVLTVSVPNVTIKNLRVEVTGSPADAESSIAIQTSDPHTVFENIEVNGYVRGLPHESEAWDLPGIISLGEFAANKENTFVLNLYAPAEAKLDSKVKGLWIRPTELTAGQNKLVLTTAALHDKTILYGEIMVRTYVTRRIYVTGKAIKDVPQHNEALPVGLPVSLPVQMSLPVEVVAPQVSDEAVQVLQKGQRLPVKELHSNQIKIIYEHRTAAHSVEVDGYCFALRENGKVSCDEDLIFFGNTESANHSIKLSYLSDSKQLVWIGLDKVDGSVGRIVVCYSVYGDNYNFSMVSAPTIRIFGGDKEVFRFALETLSREKTVIAVEVYLYKGEWKMNFVGAGYRSGLRHLCKSYGVNVDE